LDVASQSYTVSFDIPPNFNSQFNTLNPPNLRLHFSTVSGDEQSPPSTGTVNFKVATSFYDERHVITYTPQVENVSSTKRNTHYIARIPLSKSCGTIMPSHSARITITRTEGTFEGPVYVNSIELSYEGSLK